MNNFRSHQVPRATREIFIKQKYGFLEAYKNKKKSMIIFFKTINVNWVVNSMNILFGLEECAGRIGNPKTI